MSEWPAAGCLWLAARGEPYSLDALVAVAIATLRCGTVKHAEVFASSEWRQWKKSNGALAARIEREVRRTGDTVQKKVSAYGLATRAPPDFTILVRFAHSSFSIKDATSDRRRLGGAIRRRRASCHAARRVPH